MIYVDSNVILDALDDDPIWFDWSAEQLKRGQADGQLVTGWVVAAEVGHYLSSASLLQERLESLHIDLLDLNFEAAWFGGHAYREYRRRGGDRMSLLPDFLIGGHAKALGATLLTRDARRFRSYFPELALITPEENKND